MQNPGIEKNNCSSCSVITCTSHVHESTEEQLMQGGSFAAVSAGIFLTPVIFAILGASLFSESALQQFLFGSGGFICGMILTIGMGRLLNRNERGKSIHE